MSNDLVPTQDIINSINFMAKSANNSKFYSSLGGEAGIVSIMLLARELDIPPMQALSGGIWNIQGKVEMSARMMNMKIRQAGHKLQVDLTKTYCKIVGTRKDTGEQMTVTYTIEDAAQAGLASRDSWKKNPDDMLWARCVSKLARRLFPDVIGNTYVEGEIREAIEVQQQEKLEQQQQKTIVLPVENVSETKQIQYITQEQIEELNELFDECYEYGLKVLKAFTSMNSIPSVKFEAIKKGALKAIEESKCQPTEKSA